MDERKQKDEEESYGVVGLMAGATLMGDHVGLLSQYDHTGDPNRRIAGEEDVHTAEDSLRNMLAFFEGDKTEGHEETKTQVIKDLQETLVGFDYRKKNKLPGLATQFDEARRQLVSGERPTALDVLVKQPDAVELVAQLRAEYETFEEVMERGGELDLDKLEDEIYKINHGLDFVNMDVAIGRWRAVKDMEQKLVGSATLAKAQDREDLLVRLGQTAKKFESATLLQAANSLDSILGRLQMEGKAQSEDDDFAFATLVVRLGKEGRGVELISEAIKRADRLTGGAGQSDKISIIVEGVIKDLVFTMKEAGALDKSLGRLATQQATWGKIPLVGDRIRSERRRVLAEFLRVGEIQRKLTGRIEIAGGYNKLVDFLALIRIQEETREPGANEKAEEAKA